MLSKYLLLWDTCLTTPVLLTTATKQYSYQEIYKSAKNLMHNPSYCICTNTMLEENNTKNVQSQSLGHVLLYQYNTIDQKAFIKNISQ